VFAVEQKVDFSVEGFYSCVFLFEDFICDKSFVVVKALVFVGVNIRIGHCLVLRGCLCLGVGHLSFLFDVHFLMLIFIHSLLLSFRKAFRIVLSEFLLSSLSDLG
jgi:hypothetical protein